MVSIFRRILITGAGSGIGAGIANILAQKGHTIIVSDINYKDVLKVTETITTSGGQAKALQLDGGSNDSIISAIKSLDKPIDVLINNAGLQFVSRLEDFPPDKFQQLLQVMLFGAAMLTKEVLPAMRMNGFGRIINIGSIHALIASPYKSAYVAAKHGLIGFSKAIALETGDVDITINTICPAYVRTPLIDKQIKDQALSNKISENQVVKEIMLKPMPKGAFISIEELAGIVKTH